MSVKIHTLELENVKRIKALRLEPTANGLTVIGGKNGQGKTSVLDAIAWALGGEKYKPTSPAREGAYTDPILRIELSNGLVVERKGKNSSLKVIDPNGNKSGQQLLNTFISALALDLPRFMHASDSEKAKILLSILGIGEQLAELDTAETQAYNQRTVIGRIAEQKKKYAAELQCWENVPDVPVSASELIAQQQEILARNGENQRKRKHLREIESAYAQVCQEYEALGQKKEALAQDLEIARTSAQDLVDESTAALEQSIQEIDKLNIKIRDNRNKEQAEAEAERYEAEYQSLTETIREIRDKRMRLLDHADLPLPGLTVENGKLVYHGRQWDSMSGADQMRVATAIVRKLNPECGFVLLDKLEQMDTETLTEFGQWLEQEGLQAIATRVSVGDECSIIIEDGMAKADRIPGSQQPGGTWKAGAF